MKKYIFCSFFFFLFFLSNIIAQEKRTFPDKLFLQTRFHYGFIMPHHTSIEYLVKEHVPAWELNLEYQTNGDNSWEQVNNYPSFGLGIYHSSLGNDEVFGKTTAIFPYIIIPTFRYKKFEFATRFALGLSYIDSPFDLQDNYMNVAIGSKLNVYFNISVQANFELSNRIHLNCGLGFHHASNGKMKLPNYGLNTITSFLSLRYKLNSTKSERKTQEIAELKNKNKHIFFLSGGAKRYEPMEENFYKIISFSYEYIRMKSLKNGFGLGLDVFYDESIKPAIEEMEERNDVKNEELYRVGIHASYNYKIWKMLISIHTGYYFYSPYEVNNNIYNRVAIKFSLNKNLMLGGAIKSHFAKADFIEWGIGYQLFKH